MSADVGGVIGLIILVPLALFILWSLLRPAVFKWLVLPSLGRKNGWRVRIRRPPASRDLPGDGRQSWDAPIPETAREFIGTYRGKPVHGVQYSITSDEASWDSVSETWRKYSRTYSVVSTATSDRPLNGFHDRTRGASLNGDPMVLYPDFVEWARTCRTDSREDLRRDGPGVRSVAWSGRLTRRRLLRALDELTAQS